MSLTRTSLRIFCNDGLYGLQDKDGQAIVAPEYDQILDYDGDGYIRVLKGEIYGTVDLEGHPIISHKRGLTHLGVFHNGAARARNSEGWGLVDEHGEALTPFTFSHINAHVTNGYVAYDANKQKGFLTDRGHFKPSTPSSDTPSTRSRKYKKIGVFHNDIAPALTWQNVWIFIDRQLDRVNDYEYNTLDTVLREGLYLAAKRTKEESYYTAIFFDGKPFNNDHYDGPIHFENAVATCCIGEKYGIVRLDGTYLFACQYECLHWNDFDVKDCWYAEDSDFCYLLYPIGTVRTYNKFQAENRCNGLPYIPKNEIPNYIAPEDTHIKERTQTILKYVPKEFDSRAFEAKLTKFIGEEWLFSYSLKFFYRDTDAPFNIQKRYKVGHCLRAGKDLEVASKLLRPISRVRFLIASTMLVSPKDFGYKPSESYLFERWSDNIIYHNACFLVADVFQYMGKTQILLLQLPYRAIRLALNFGYQLSKLPCYGPKGEPLKEYAQRCFINSMSQPVHGNSISPRWVKKMYQPIGLNDEFKPYSFEPTRTLRIEWEEVKNAADAINFYYQYNPYNYNDWSVGAFYQPTDNLIEVVVGDLNQVRAEAIVELEVLINYDGEYGGEKNTPTDTAAKSQKTSTNIEFQVESVEDMPFKKLIQATAYTYHPTPSFISHCYEQILRYASRQGIHDIAFSPTAYAFKPKFKACNKEKNIVLETIEKAISKHIFQGRIVICCRNKQEAETITIRR